MRRVVMYSTEPCSFCRNAKALLAKRGIEYEEINLAKDPDGRAELAEKTGLMSFPQVVVDGEVVGGFQDLIRLDRAGRLTELLAA
ncbi:MAG: glutaredoxin 3 [Solirubrobacteraceae bacterium]|jgi:glutaredoxin 3|nr:glutaredoxin 3 [Solirubrobacteraceae bacterium]